MGSGGKKAQLPEMRRKVAKRQAHISGPVMCQKPGREKTGNFLPRSQIQKPPLSLIPTSFSCAKFWSHRSCFGVGGGVFSWENWVHVSPFQLSPPHLQKEAFSQH